MNKLLAVISFISTIGFVTLTLSPPPTQTELDTLKHENDSLSTVLNDCIHAYDEVAEVLDDIMKERSENND